MQDLLVAGGTVIDPVAGTMQRADLRIVRGKIAEVGPGLASTGEPELDATGKLVSPGWMDMHVHLREPGQEHKETIESGCRAAAAGGFTAVACMPNTDPPVDSREAVHSIIERAADLPVDVHPIACVSTGRDGKELTNMAELADSGAVAFSDDGSPVQSSSLMRRALEYARMCNRPIINHMEDLTMGPKGHMHEGLVSTRLGMQPVPALSEEAMVGRDVMLAELTGGHLHVAHVSTALSTDLIRQVKARGVNVTAEACAHHFALTDELVESSGFSSHAKMHPPLRSSEDVEAIKAGLADGTLDAICTDHAPHAPFEKEVEFYAAPDGIIGLETCWGLTGEYLIKPGRLSVMEAVRKVCVAPRQILGLPIPAIALGAPANLTVFDATSGWTFTPNDIRSKSRNTPFIGCEMTGKVVAIFNRGQLVDSSGL